MANFCVTKATVYLSIYPKLFNDPYQCIHKQISRFLLQYSKILSGILFSFNIEGIIPKGKILEDGSVYINTLIEACVLKIAEGDEIEAVDGMYMKIFTCVVDKEENFNGTFIVKKIEKNGKIFGTGINEEEEEF